MSGSFRIARIADIDIKIHITFFLILILAAFQWSGITGSPAGALFGVVLMLLLFVCVTLHELGHSLVARAFGIHVREITLLPLGGVAMMTKNPDKPLHELLIAAAGPLVNVVIAAVLIAPDCASPSPSRTMREKASTTMKRGSSGRAMSKRQLLVPRSSAA